MVVHLPKKKTGQEGGKRMLFWVSCFSISIFVFGTNSDDNIGCIFFVLMWKVYRKKNKNKKRTMWISKRSKKLIGGCMTLGVSMVTGIPTPDEQKCVDFLQQNNYQEQSAITYVNQINKFFLCFFFFRQNFFVGC